MPTLATCIRKAGKALNSGDADAIREIYDDLRADGVPAAQAGTQAIDEYLGSLADERTDIVTQIEAQGGIAPGAGVVRFAADSSRIKRIANRLNIRRLLSDRERLTVRATGADGQITMKDVATALQERALGVDSNLEEMTEENKAILATNFADEVEAALEATGHAGHWYSDKMRNAVALISEIHPELKTDADKLSMFLAGLAITSNGQPVGANAENAEIQYAAFKESGFKEFPDFGVGKESQQMKKAFQVLNNLIKARGIAGTRQFLATEYTKRELMDLGFGSILAGEGTDFRTHGSGVFGPKIGAGFYQNLIGNFNPLTTDRWFMRTWGRMVGKLMQDPNSTANEGRKDRLRKAFKTKKGKEKLTELGYTISNLANEESLLDVAARLHKEYAKGDFKDKTEWNMAAKNLDVGINDTIGAPTGAVQRNWIREVVAEARSILEQRGTDVDTATLQALVWFPEKELYAKYGVGDAKAAPTDYEQEYARIAERQGVDPATIRGILRRQTGRSAGGVQPRRTDSFTALKEGLTAKERKFDLTHTALSEIRRSGRTTYGGAVPKGAQRLVGSAPVQQTFKPDKTVKNLLERTGNSAPVMQELSTDEDAIASAQEFTNAITAAAKANQSGASVYVYPQEEYENARLFLTEDGKAGFALMGDDIVSVFKHPDADMPGVVHSMMLLATSQGGRRLDAFDTILPHFYGMTGFRVVSRIPWDETQKPEGWNKEDFKDYNDGEPDVVFMAWDPDNFNVYMGEGQMFADYGEASDLQLAAVTDTAYVDPGDIRLSIEDGPEEFVDDYPNIPQSQLFKYAATVEQQAQTAPSASKIVKDRVTNLGTPAIAGNLMAIHRNYLADFMPDNRMDAITTYNHEIRAMDGRKNELTERYGETGKKMFWHKAKHREAHAKLGELMHYSTITGADPSIPYKSIKKRENMTEADKKADTLRRAEYKIMKDYYDNQLDETGRELYKEVRDQYAHLRKQQENAIMARIDMAEADGKAKTKMKLEMRKLFEAGRVQGPYFPLDRWGDFWGVARNEDGEVYSFSKFETQSQANDWKAAMRKAGFEVQTGKKVKEDLKMVRQLDPDLVARVKKLTDNIEGGDAIADEMYQLYLKSLPELSMRKHFIHRKGRIGFSADILRSYAANMFHGATQIARMETQPRLEAAMTRLFEQAQAAEQREDAHSAWAMPIYNEMLTRHKLAMDPPSGQLANMATSFGFAWLLGVTPGAAILNLFQTPMFAMPTVAARKGNGSVKTTVAFGRAIGEYFTTRIGGYKNKLRDDRLKAYEWAEQTGILSKTMSHDLADLIEMDGSQYGIRKNVMTVVSYLFHHTEQANRQVTFMAAYDLARARGLSHNDALWDAADLNDRSHYDYSASNRPPIMQKEFMKVMLLFKNYGIHSTYQLARATKDGFFAQEGLPKEARQEARRKLTGILMMTGLLGGVSSIPFAWVVESILDAVWGDEDEPFNAGQQFRVYLKEDLGWSEGQIVALMDGGWDAFTGGTMSSRISLNYLGLGRESYKPLEGAELYAHILEEAAGPVPSLLIGAPAMAALDWSEPNKPFAVWRGIERIAPKFARDAMRAYRYNAEGALTYSREPIMLPDEFTTRDLFMQAAGLAPTELTLRYEQNRGFKNMEQAILKRYKVLKDRYFITAQYGTPAEKKEAELAFVTFANTYPEMQITPETLEQAAMARWRTNVNTYGGSLLDPRLNLRIRKAMTWLDPPQTGEPLPLPPGVKP